MLRGRTKRGERCIYILQVDKSPHLFHYAIYENYYALSIFSFSLNRLSQRRLPARILVSLLFSPTFSQVKKNVHMTIEEYIQQGQTALGQTDLPAAREAFEAATELDETHAPAWQGLGYVLLGEGELAQAVECFEYARGEDETLTPPWTALGHLAAQQEDEQTATQYYKNAIQLDPQNPDPWNGLGILYAGKLRKPQEAVRCFVRAEYLGGDQHINNTFLLFSQLPPYPFFSYRIIRDYMPPAVYPKWKEYRKVALEEALPLQTFLTWQNLRIERGETPPPAWEMWLGIIHFLTGDPATALKHLDKAQAEQPETDLMIAYYQIQSAWDFVQADAPYLEAALTRAETYLPEVKSSGWGPFARKKTVAPPLPSEELAACYYAGLIFIEADELKKALLCFERIEQDFLPAAYQALWLTEEMVLPKKKKEKATALLERENQSQAYTVGLPVYRLNTDDKAFLQYLDQANRYLELADAIDIFHYHAEFEGNPYDYEITMAKDQRPFYLLWELPEESKDVFLEDTRTAFYQKVETGLAEALAHLAGLSEQDTMEGKLASAIDAGLLDAKTTSPLTAYFQYKNELETPSRHLLDLYAQTKPAAEETEEPAKPLDASLQELIFLIDGLTQPEAMDEMGDQAHHFAAFQSEREEPPASFEAFRTELAAFIQDRPAPETEEDAVVLEEVRGEEE